MKSLIFILISFFALQVVYAGQGSYGSPMPNTGEAIGVQDQNGNMSSIVKDGAGRIWITDPYANGGCNTGPNTPTCTPTNPAVPTSTPTGTITPPVPTTTPLGNNAINLAMSPTPPQSLWTYSQPVGPVVTAQATLFAGVAAQVALATAVPTMFNAFVSVNTPGTAPNGSMLISGEYKSTQPTLTDGQGAPLGLDTRTNLKVTLMGLNGTTSPSLQTANADAVNSTSTALDVFSFPALLNPAGTWDRQKSFAPAGTATPGQSYSANILVDPNSNTTVAQVAPWINNASVAAGVTGAVCTNSELYLGVGGGTCRSVAAKNSNVDTQAPDANADEIFTFSMPAYLNNANQLSRAREVDGVSNTQTALGVMAIGAASYTQAPVTFTSTGSVTFAQFIPQSTSGSCEITTTGSITAASVSIYGSNDGLAFGSLGSQFTLTSFSGTDILTWANEPAIYIKPIVTITTLGGTNVIITCSVGHP